MKSIDSLLQLCLACVLVGGLVWALVSTRAAQRPARWPAFVLFLLTLYAILFFWAMARRAEEFGRSSRASAGGAR